MKEEGFLLAATISSNALYEKLEEAAFPYDLIQGESPGATELSMKLGSALGAHWPYCLLSLVTLIAPSLHRVSAKMANFLSVPALPSVALTGISGGGEFPPLGIVGGILLLMGKK